MHTSGWLSERRYSGGSKDDAGVLVEASEEGLEEYSVNGI